MTEAPYGTWRSPIDGDAVARDPGWAYSLITVDGGAVYWSETRPLEDGRDAIVVRRPGEPPVDVIPSAFNARSRVHEYGGGAYTVHDGTVYFSHDDDQRIYRLAPGSEPEPIAPPGARYADLRVTPDGRRLVCVRERDGEPEYVNDLISLATDGSEEPQVIASGHDFFSSPRISPDGTRIAWLAWDHPRMPWEGCELYVDGRVVAGGPAEAIVQPEWSPDGVLHYCSDRTNWWNLYRDGEPLTALEAEIGGPLWVFGQSWYAFLPDGRIVCTYFRDGRRSPRRSRRQRAARRADRADADRRPHHRRRARAVHRRLPHALAAGRRRRPRDGHGRAAERGRRRGRRHRVRVGAAAARAPARAVLSAAQPGLHRVRPASARRCWSASTAARPRTSARGCHRRSSSSPAAASRSSTSTTAAAPATAASTATGSAASGGSSTPTTRSTPRSRWPRRATSTATGWRSPAAVRAAGPCCARSRSARRYSPPAPTISASPISWASSTTRTSSSPATTTGSSARGRRPPISGGSARRSTTRTRSARR